MLQVMVFHPVTPQLSPVTHVEASAKLPAEEANATNTFASLFQWVSTLTSKTQLVMVVKAKPSLLQWGQAQKWMSWFLCIPLQLSLSFVQTCAQFHVSHHTWMHLYAGNVFPHQVTTWSSLRETEQALWTACCSFPHFSLTPSQIQSLTLNH